MIEREETPDTYTKGTRSKQLPEPHPMPANALEYPRFAGISTFIRLPHIPDASRLDVALIGVPYDGGTSYRTGPRMGPRQSHPCLQRTYYSNNFASCLPSSD
jgi:Arginase family